MNPYTIKVFLSLLSTLLLLQPCLATPFPGSNDRIGWSADGNMNDPDDWGATAMALAIFAKAGWQDKVVHIDYNNWLPGNNPVKSAEQAASVIEGARQFGFEKTRIHDNQTDLEGAIESVVREINRSSRDNLFWYVQAGPFEVAYRALMRADPEKRKFCILVSHSEMNERANKWTNQHGKNDCVALGATYFFTTGQGKDKFGGGNFYEWHLVDWMKESPCPGYRWVHSRFTKVAEHKDGVLDASDGGMAYALVTGDFEGNFNPKLREFLGDGWEGSQPVMTSKASPTIAQVLAMSAKTRPPNLLFIMTDQQRFDAMSCAGNTVLETPNMDRLAREGVMFANAYSANPVCVPARAVFLTGYSPVNVRVEGNGDYESEDVPDVPTFDSILAGHGYAAEYYGKWHTPYQFAECYDNVVKAVGSFGNKIPGANQIKAYQDWLISRGVEPKLPGDGELYSSRNQRPYTPIHLDWSHDKAHLPQDEKMQLKVAQATQYGRVDLPPRISYPAFTADETLEALDRLKDVPFTLTCSFDPPHPPTLVQEPYYSMYPPESIPVPQSIDDPMDDSPYKSRSLEDDQMHYRDPGDIREMRSIYYGMVREVDDLIGEILDKLDELGIADDTLVVFTSDHGEMLGDHGMHSKMIFYEGSVHVPLIMRFPGRIKPGTIVEETVSSMDVFATILEYMGMTIPRNNGINLRLLIEGRGRQHDVVSYSLGGDRPNYMIRSGNLKLMMSQVTDSKAVDALYDLEADPLEMRNLIRSPVSPEKNRTEALMMKDRLVKWLKQHEPHKAEQVEKRELY